MKNIEDVKTLIILIIIADVIGGLIYGSKGDMVGIFNCVAWAVIAGFVLANFDSVFKAK
ncbi:MAG: hypothetical protein PHV68_03530 [Candidatus Gastranaerophilales bacterium]|nr:hypothetical protein [Candidatus Gastranaerophilales bacterium]